MSYSNLDAVVLSRRPKVGNVIVQNFLMSNCRKPLVLKLRIQRFYAPLRASFKRERVTNKMFCAITFRYIGSVYQICRRK